MDLTKYIYAHCCDPVKISVYDSLQKCHVVREVPCGKCLHCRNTHINEWCTRLYAQAKYSANVYYITLDYAPFNSSSAARKLAIETGACWHNINKTRHYALHPLLLVKNHLQDYFKRLRKLTQMKLQYFACGEYGTHAEGKGYGRPHFHAIVFSNEPISKEQFERAWTVDGYKIGNVDFNDMRANGSFDEINNNSLNANYVFKYVCKYLQKANFDFEKLATIDFHRAYFSRTLENCVDTDTLFPYYEQYEFKDSAEMDVLWNEYKRRFSPFVVCSRRPSIGFAYFEENKERFKKQDFRLFGLSAEVSIFPRYFVRKTKEILCPFSCIGKDSDCPTSNSRVPYVLSVLRSLCDYRTNVENFNAINADDWCTTHIDGELVTVHNRPNCYLNKNSYKDLHLFDVRNKSFYIFNGYDYAYWHKYNKLGYTFVNYIPIEEMIKKISPYCDSLVNDYLLPVSLARQQKEKELQDSLRSLYGDDYMSKFKDDCRARLAIENAKFFKRDLLCQNSKTTL